MIVPVFKHLLVRAEIKNPPKDEAETVKWLRDFVNSIDMKILDGPFAHYVKEEGNVGMTGMVMIETSHIAMHVWDEVDPAIMHFDCFTCGCFEPEEALRALNEFDMVSYQHKYFDREFGFDEEEF